MNCSSRVNSSFDGLPGLKDRERDDVLDQHFLLGAEAATHALAEHANLGRVEVEQSRQRPPRQIRRLRAGTDHEPAGLVEPADGAMGLQVRVLHPLGDVGPLVDNVGFRKAGVDIADMAVQFAGDVALRIVDARLRALVVDHWRAGPHRLFRIEHSGQQFVIDGELATAFFRRRLAVRDHRRDALPDEADDAVEHGGIVRIAAFVLVPRRREQFLWRVLECQHRADTGNGKRLIPTYRRDPGVRVRRAQQLEMQQPGRRDIHRVARGAADDGARRRRRHAAAAGVPGLGLFDRLTAAQRLIDRAVAGAAADVALERPTEIATLRLVHARGGHDHARRAEAALKALRVQKGLLHRMQFAVLGQAFDRGDGAALRAIGREQTGMDRIAVDHDGAGAAVAGVAAFLDAEAAELA